MMRSILARTGLSAIILLTALPSCTGMMLGVDDGYGYYDNLYHPTPPAMVAPPPPPYPGYPGDRYPSWSYPKPGPAAPPPKPGGNHKPSAPAPPKPPHNSDRPSAPSTPAPKPDRPATTPGVRPGATGTIQRPAPQPSGGASTHRQPTGGASGRH